MGLFKKYLYPILLFILVLIISYLTYKPDTFLTGWDTLHPEFNFNLNFERMLNGVWREEQGLGAVSGHSHMADLPRVALLWLLHLVLPLESLRYSYIFLCLFLGVLGMYFLTRYLLKSAHFSEKLPASSIAFISSLFYLVSPAAIQQFYAPFEMFTTQYALLPWLILCAMRYLHKKKFLLIFGLLTLLSTPQAYAAHLWYPFFGAFLLYLMVRSLLSNKGEKNIGRSFVLILVTLAINSFWLLPNLYYIFTSSTTPKESKQNRIFSQEYRIRNQENGFIQDVALGKGFYFQWSAYNFQKNGFEYLMPEWRDHLSKPSVMAIGYASFALILAGLFVSFKRKNVDLIAISPFLIIPFILLMNSTPPFSWLFNYLLKFSLFEEALRFVFTKLSILLLFSYAIFLGVGIAFFWSKLKNRVISFSALFVIILLLLLYGLPLFKGELISDKFKVAIPERYFELWNYMESQPNEPVLTLPLHTFSGWQYYKWDYQGSGFIWFGMKQPVLDRDSDRWSVANEQAFRELQYTLYSQRPDQFERTLEKFNIGYLIWDTSVITPSEKNRNQILYQRETTATLETLLASGKLTKLQTFGSIQVFKVQKNPTTQPEIKKITTSIQPVYRWNFVDQAFLDHGDYITTDADIDLASYNYPFRDFLIVTDRFKDEAAASVAELEHPLHYDAKRLSDNQLIPDIVTLEKENNENVVRFRTKNFSRGVAMQNDTFPHDLGYVIGFTSRNIQGLPLRFCLKNLYSNICNIYDELSRSKDWVSDYFVVPPFESGQGYGLYIDNISYGNYETVNELREVVTYPLYYDYLSIQNDRTDSGGSVATILNNQAFHPGWIALADNKALDHTLVNNWANGWILPENASQNTADYRIIFWPQYLEYLGFFLVFATLGSAVFAGRKKQ